MYVSVYAALVASATFGLVVPVARQLPPALATWLLSAGGLLVSLASTAALGFLSLTLVGRLSLLARLGHWSVPSLRHTDPVQPLVAWVALLLLAFLAVRVTVALCRWSAALLESHRVAALMPAHELVVLDEAQPSAYAVPGRPGHIVVSTGLLRRLSAGERRAVLAHERAHLAHRHHLHHTAAALAAALNPCLARVPEAVAAGCERWADESAASVCSRSVVADALTGAGTGALRPSNPLVLAGVVDVAERVSALRQPAPRTAWWRLALVGAVLAAVALPALDAGQDLHALFEHAQAVCVASCR